jgi:hypothetical protein
MSEEANMKFTKQELKLIYDSIKLMKAIELERAKLYASPLPVEIEILKVFDKVLIKLQAMGTE